MLYRTRCYPTGGLSPVLCMARNAQSTQVEIGAVAMAQLLDHLRPRVRHYATPLVAGLRRPTLTVDAYVEHALVTVGAALDACDAITDAAFYAWVSITTTSAVLEHHAAVRRLLATRRSNARRRDAGLTHGAGNGRAA